MAVKPYSNIILSISFLYRVTEEYDLVANPIYNISTPQQGLAIGLG